MSLLLGLAACAGCADDDAGVPSDGGAGGDADVIDGSVMLDGAGAPDGGVADAGADAGPARLCVTPDPCDPITATGCDTGQVCVLAGETPGCVESAGSLSAGAPCETVSDCPTGHACFLTREGGGRCDPLCCDDDYGGSCGPDMRCGAGVLVDGTEIDWGRCLPEPTDCDVLDPVATCEPAEGCYIVTATGDTTCRPAGTRTVGEPCAEQNDCEPGLACRGLQPTCQRICDLTMVDPCPFAEGNCVDQPLWPENVGLCTIDVTLLVQ